MADSKSEFVYDSRNEVIVIGAALASKDVRAKLVRRLSPDEFLAPHHAVIWRALRVMADGKLEVTDEVLGRLVSDAGGNDDAVAYALEIDRQVPKNVDWHVDTLSWDATRARVLSTSAAKLVSTLSDPRAERQDVVTSARAVARALEGSSRRHMRRPEETYRHYRAEIAARRVSRNVYPLGIDVFDRNLSEGFAPGRTTVSAGLPGAGKSTVWMAFAIMLARAGRRPLYCAWEMPVESLLDVGVSYMTGIPLVDIVQGNLTDQDAVRVGQATGWISKHVMFMSNPFFDAIRAGGKPSNEKNLDTLEGYIAESGCDVVIYDLWERMLPWRKPEDVSGALFRMQAMHEEYAVHGVIIQQLLLKDVERRTDKRPTRESIKGTGAYVEVADLIFGIYRVGQFKDVDDDRVETICLKQRKGRPNWAVSWRWDGSRCLVEDPREVRYDPGLEAAFEAGDIAPDEALSSPSQIGNRKRRKRGSSIGRREQ